MLIHIEQENKIINIDNLTSINKYDYEEYFSIIFNLVSVRMVEVQYKDVKERNKVYNQILKKLPHIII